MIGQMNRDRDRRPPQHSERRFFDVESGDYSNAFADEYVRQNFIRKVYVHLVLQLSIVFLVTVMFNFDEPLRNHYIVNFKLYYFVSIPITFVFFIMLMCYRCVRHTFPINYIVLIIYNIAWGFVIVGLSLVMDPQLLMIAFGLTTGIFLLLTLFAMITSIDFTNFIGAIAIASIVIMVIAIVSMFVRVRILHLVLSGLVIIVFSFYIIIDTQMMVGGKHSFIFDETEYLLASVHLFVDFITMFIHILNLLAGDE